MNMSNKIVSVSKALIIILLIYTDRLYASTSKCVKCNQHANGRCIIGLV